MDRFGSYLKKRRNKLGFTQEEVGEYTNLSVRVYAKIENGEVAPKVDTLEALSIIFKEDLVEIFYELYSYDKVSFSNLFSSIDEKTSSLESYLDF